MILIIIGLVIGIVIGITYWISYGDFIDYLGASIIFGLFGMFIGFLLAVMLPMETYNKHYTLNIETLQDNNSINSNFFLGTGQVDGKMKYTLYYEENGLYQMMQLDYDLVKIKYSDGKPKINIIEKYPTDSYINKFAIDLDCYDKTYIIEAPNGAIKNNYNLNAQ